MQILQKRIARLEPHYHPRHQEQHAHHHGKFQRATLIYGMRSSIVGKQTIANARVDAQHRKLHHKHHNAHGTQALATHLVGNVDIDKQRHQQHRHQEFHRYIHPQIAAQQQYYGYCRHQHHLGHSPPIECLAKPIAKRPDKEHPRVVVEQKIMRDWHRVIVKHNVGNIEHQKQRYGTRTHRVKHPPRSLQTHIENDSVVE